MDKRAILTLGALATLFTATSYQQATEHKDAGTTQQQETAVLKVYKTDQVPSRYAGTSLKQYLMSQGFTENQAKKYEACKNEASEIKTTDLSKKTQVKYTNRCMVKGL